jgi:hypothetical protein
LVTVEKVPGEARIECVRSTICKISFLSIFSMESVRIQELNPAARRIYSLDDESTLSDTNSQSSLRATCPPFVRLGEPTTSFSRDVSEGPSRTRDDSERAKHIAKTRTTFPFSPLLQVMVVRAKDPERCYAVAVQTANV